MPQQGQYSHAHKACQASGDAPKKDNSSMTIEGNVIDESGPGIPKLPPKQSPQLPADDAFLKYRTQQT